MYDSRRTDPSRTDARPSDTSPVPSPAGPVEPTYRAAPHVRCVTESDGAVLLDLRAGKYFSLNDVGGTIWGGIEAPTDESERGAGARRDEILAHLESTYAASREQLANDLDAFLGALLEKGLLIEAESASNRRSAHDG